MLIGQIEQEILEGIFWSSKLKTHCYSSTSDYLQADLQKDEAEAIWKSQQPELDRASRVSQPLLSLEDSSED
jgi:hypothetical protein